jgi:prepilin-type N-terminal cleavage/methylation domain-containing protein
MRDARGFRCRINLTQGFTLLELIVVVLLLTILLGFAIPAFQDPSSLADSAEGAARQLVSAVNRLKIAAMDRQSTHTLHLDLDQGRLWVAREEAQTEDDTDHVPTSEWALPDDVRIAQVRLPGDRDIRSGTVSIGFYPQGYSDRAMIELAVDGEPPIELVIEAFLPEAYIASEDRPPPF